MMGCLLEFGSDLCTHTVGGIGAAPWLCTMREGRRVRYFRTPLPCRYPRCCGGPANIGINGRIPSIMTPAQRYWRAP